MFSRAQTHRTTSRIPCTTQNSQAAGSERLSFVTARRANPVSTPIHPTPDVSPQPSTSRNPFADPLDLGTLDDPLPSDHYGDGNGGDAGHGPGGDPDQGPGGDPDDDPIDLNADQPDDETPNLAAALALLAKSLQKPRSDNAKVR